MYSLVTGAARIQRRALGALLLVALVLSATSIPSSPARAALREDYVRTANGEVHVVSAFNQLRGANQLVVYTPEFGASTKNNRWGVEVIVRNDTAVQVRDGVVDGTADAPIPDDGYVISGHGTARSWILANIREGERVELLRDVILEPVRVATAKLTKIDPQPPREFPGGRGADELVLYTPNYGEERTGTNQYGVEVVVEDGIVVESGGNNSLIPANGFVLSGHGTMKDWLLQNTQIGAEVTVDYGAKTVTVRIDAKAYINAAALVLDEAATAIEDAEARYLDVPLASAKDLYDQASATLDEARDAYEREDWEATIELSEQATQLARRAIYHTVESRAVEGRGIWHRPVEKDRQEVAATMDRLAAANFNILFLETFFHGYTIYPSDKAEQNPDFRGWDPLRAFIEEGQKRGIEVHGWVHTFFVGHESLNPPGPVLRAHPDWAAVDREGRIPSVKEPGYYWVNPALPAVRDYLSGVFGEMTTEYELDGLHLDYIRYPVSLPIQYGYSYDEYSRNQFERQYGADPLEITPESNPELWQKWNLWRESQITTFVDRIQRETKQRTPDVLISTAVFPEVSDARDKKFQNWIEWVERGYLDFITPMVYSIDTNWVGATTREFLANLKTPTLSYIGLAPFIGFTPETLVEQIDAVNEANAAGQALFAYHNLKPEHFAALKDGPYRRPAVLPHRDPAAASSVLAADIQRKLREVYVARGAVRPSEAAPITQKLRTIRPALEREDYAQALRRVDDLRRFIDVRERTGHLNAQVADNLRHDLAYLTSILEYGEAQR